MFALLSSLSGLFCLVYTAMIGSFIAGWIKMNRSSDTRVSGLLKVSVLIAARNEEDCILLCIGDILKQEYPAHLLEIIIVDDHSTDATSDKVIGLHHAQVKLIRLNESQALNSYKKKAITSAIGLASGELIVTTDADCRMGPLWIASLVSLYEQGNCKLISAPVAYFQETNKFERLQTTEFMSLIAMGASAIANKTSFTCNGANLAYSRQVFTEVEGFTGIDHLASGDDELFLHKVSAVYPDGIGFLKSRNAIVYTYAKESLKEFIKQRKRWASKSLKYTNKFPVFLIVLVYAFYLSIPLNLLASFLWPGLWKIAVLEIFVKLLVDWILLYLAAEFFNRRDLAPYFIPGSFLHIFYFLYIGMISHSGTYEWKDRTVK